MGRDLAAHAVNNDSVLALVSIAGGDGPVALLLGTDAGGSVAERFPQLELDHPELVLVAAVSVRLAPPVFYGSLCSKKQNHGKN